MDVASADGAAQVQRIVPDVDVLINNLGIYGARPALEISDAEWLRFFEVNVLAAIRLTRSYVPAMVGRQWGRIQCVASDSAVSIPPEMIHYGMSKTALLAVARGFAQEAAGTHRVVWRHGLDRRRADRIWVARRSVICSFGVFSRARWAICRGLSPMS